MEIKSIGEVVTTVEFSDEDIHTLALACAVAHLLAHGDCAAVAQAGIPQEAEEDWGLRWAVWQGMFESLALCQFLISHVDARLHPQIDIGLIRSEKFPELLKVKEAGSSSTDKPAPAHHKEAANDEQSEV